MSTTNAVPQPAIDEATVETIIASIQAKIEKARASRDQGAVTAAIMRKVAP